MTDPPRGPKRKKRLSRSNAALLRRIKEGLLNDWDFRSFLCDGAVTGEMREALEDYGGNHPHAILLIFEGKKW